MIKSYAKENQIDLTLIKFENKEQAQNSPTPFTTYSIYNNGKFITHEILNEKKFESLFNKYKQNNKVGN